MLGDPLHLIVIFGTDQRGMGHQVSCGKILFCVGFGLHSPTFGKPDISTDLYRARGVLRAWFYINNHMVFFCFRYAPWILLSAIAWLDMRSGRQIRWGWFVVGQFWLF